MTLQKLMDHTAAILTARGERKCPAIAGYVPILYEEMISLANRQKVLSLVTKSADARVLRSLGGGDYIRMPKEPRTENDKIDMDEELMYALSNFVAASVAAENVNIALYHKKGSRLVKDYAFKLFNTPTEIN